MPAFSVGPIEFNAGAAALHSVRDAVFVHEQGVPIDLEHDTLDPLCVHVLARDDASRPIGTGRLSPDGRIGRMAVLAPWRGQGVGAAMLSTLTALARGAGRRELLLHAQARVVGFYARQGFLPHGQRFDEAGIEHLSMRRRLDGPDRIEDRDAALACITALCHQARRDLCIHSRTLDPGLFDSIESGHAVRQLATRGDGGRIRILLQDASNLQRERTPLIALLQRLPSVVSVRVVDEPGAHHDPSAFVANDNGGYYLRDAGSRFDGEACHEAPARAEQLCRRFDQRWEAARPCHELRALGI